MRLLRDELYKITTRKIVLIGFVAALCIQVLCFVSGGVASERSVVNGRVYKGIDAIQKDREITREFEGELTDDKVQEIIQKYGFLEFDSERHDINCNYLNHMIYYNGLCDGKAEDWNHIEQPAKVIPLAETAMGKLLEMNGLRPQIAYTRGLEILETNMGIAGINVCLILMAALTSVFSEEYSLHTANILLTTVHGKKADIKAKLGAAFLFAVALFLIMEIFEVFLCAVFYGFGGLGNLYGSVHQAWYVPQGNALNPCLLTMGQFLLIMLVFMLAGIIMLTAFALFASAWAKQPFGALILTLIFYVLPAGVWFYLMISNPPETELVTAIRRFILCTPMYSCMNGGVAETLNRTAYWYRGSLFAVVSVPSILFSYRRYKNYQAA